MAVSTFSTYLKNRMLDQSIPSPVYAQAHSGDPGASGTSNVCAGLARVGVTFPAASSGARTKATTDQFTNIPAGTSIAFISYWDALTNGNFLWSDDCENPPGTPRTETYAGDGGVYNLTNQSISVG